MGSRVTQHPAIPEPTQHNYVEVLRAIKESLEIGRTDKRGDPMDQWVTKRELQKAGVLQSYDESTVRAGGVGPGLNPGGNESEIGGPPTGTGEFLPPFDPNKVRPLPSRPKNVITRTVWDGIQVKWDWPIETDVDWLGAVIWMSATPSFEEGSFLGYATTNAFLHSNIGLSAGDYSIRYYWVAWFAGPGENGEIDNPFGIPGVGRQTEWSPYSYQEGVQGNTAVDPAYVLQTLENRITESEIFDTLNERINLIDYDSEGEQYFTPVQDRILAASQAASGDIYAAIAEVARTSVSDEPGAHEATGEFSVRVDLAGYVVGYGLSAFSRMDTQTGTRSSGSSFVIRAEEFAIASPIEYNIPGFPQFGFKEPDIEFPFIVGKIDDVWTVGINGQLVVDGTITARSLQAETIGAREINAASVWADLVTAERVISNSFKTSNFPAVRVEINGRGESETYPIWFGSGAVSGNYAEGVSEPAFYFTNTGDMVLSGELRVTGPGKFYVGSNDADEWRLEIGGYEGNTLMWVGAGPIDTSDKNPNWLFYIDKDGNAQFRGTVEAKFVSGEISRVTVIHETETINGGIKSDAKTSYTKVSSIPPSAWTELGRWECPESPFDPHLPTMNLAAIFYGNGVKAGAVRVLWKYGGATVELYRTAVDIWNYGGMHSFNATAPQRVGGVSYFIVEFVGFDSGRWTGTGPIYCNRRNGLVMGIR